MIEIESLYKYYGTSRAIGPLSAHIGDGEVVGLLGLNGAGKTTTLRILSCDLLPSSGTVRIDGLDVVTAPERVRRLIGYLPDTPPLYDEMTVAAYLRFAAQLRRCPTRTLPERINRTLAVTGLSSVSSSQISTLSHGYRQRLGIAQAIVHEPRLVVLDEPSSGLDPVQIREMRSLVRALGERHTVLISSHNLAEISEMCDRLLVIREGAIVASGTEEELVAQWLHGARFALTLQTTERREDVLAWLNGLDFVDAASSAAGGPVSTAGAQMELLVQMSPGCRPQLSRAVVERGLDLVGLAHSERDLENVFAKLAQSSFSGEQ